MRQREIDDQEYLFVCMTCKIMISHISGFDAPSQSFVPAASLLKPTINKDSCVGYKAVTRFMDRSMHA